MLSSFELATSLSLSVIELRAIHEREQLNAERRSCAQAIAGYRTAATLDRDARGRYLPRRREAEPLAPWWMAL
jgi:hypothetical protein